LQELADVLKGYTGMAAGCCSSSTRISSTSSPTPKGGCGTTSSVPRCKNCPPQRLSFLQCHETLKQRFGAHPEKFYWREGDMHYAFTGLEQYSAAVAEFMDAAIINPKESPQR